MYGGSYSFICLLNIPLYSNMVQVHSGWAVSRRGRHNQIAIFYRYLLFTFHILDHCASPFHILIYSALLLSIHSGSLCLIVEYSACPRGMFVMLVVLCLTYNITEFYIVSINFFTAIFLTPPNTCTAYFFCPKKLTSPLAPLLRITGLLDLHGRPG